MSRHIHAVLIAVLGLSLPHDAAAQMTLRRAVPAGQPPAEFMGRRTITFAVFPGPPMLVNTVVQRRQCEAAHVCQSAFRMPQRPQEPQEPRARGCMTPTERVMMPAVLAAGGWGIGLGLSILTVGLAPRTAGHLMRGGLITGLVAGTVASATARSCP